MSSKKPVKDKRKLGAILIEQKDKTLPVLSLKGAKICSGIKSKNVVYFSISFCS